MSTIVWLLVAAGLWLAVLCATCLLLSFGKRADARLGPDARESPGRRPDAYRLFVRDEPAAQLHWRNDPACPAGWYLWQRQGDWCRMDVDPGVDVFGGMRAQRPGWRQAGDLAAAVSAAIALDAATDLLCGPPTPPPRPLPPGRYELHVAGLAPDVVPIAFPEAISASHGDVCVLAGHFDDPSLTALTRRIAILGGRLLALLPGDPADPGERGPWRG